MTERRWAGKGDRLYCEGRHMEIHEHFIVFLLAIKVLYIVVVIRVVFTPWRGRSS